MTEPDSERRAAEDGLSIGDAYDRSRFGHAVESVAESWRSTIRPVATESRSVAVVRVANGIVDRMLSLVASAAIVRWLSRPPTEDAIVVDLHDSVLVGPICPLLRAGTATVDDVFDAAESYWTGSWLGTVIREYPLRVAGATVLCLLALWLVTAWPDVTRASLGVASVLTGAALLGMRADKTAADLAETTVGRVVAALLLPPGDVE